jgi:hypothetical protein
LSHKYKTARAPVGPGEKKVHWGQNYPKWLVSRWVTIEVKQSLAWLVLTYLDGRSFGGRDGGRERERNFIFLRYLIKEII